MLELSWLLACVALALSMILGEASTPEFGLNNTKQAATSDGRVVAVLVSDRVQGILPSIGTIVDTSTSDVEVLLIGDMESGLEARSHFEGRVNVFNLLTVEAFEDDLLSQGINPIWKWNEFGSSHRPDWQGANTIHLADWDGLATHENILNHARFYIPYLSILQDVDAYFLIDDDIIVRGDIGRIAETAAETFVDESTGIVCPCNIWNWDEECTTYEFRDREEKMLGSTPMYGSAPVCRSDTQVDCVPETYRDFLEAVTPATRAELEEELAWNFGFCFVSRQNWFQLNLTERYEAVMKASYQDHVFPENSLAFGLGVAYLAFAGSISCWGESVRVLDGFSFVDPESYHQAFGKDYISTVDVMHYTGPSKPWEDFSGISPENLDPWFDAMEREGMELPQIYPSKPTQEVFSVLSSWGSGTEWVFEMLDQHPEVCASGETANPQRGFPRNAMGVDEDQWISECSTKKGCYLQFVLDQLEELLPSEAESSLCAAIRTRNATASDHDDPLPRVHLVRLCNVIDELQGDYSQRAAVKVWVDAFVTENQDLLGCSCPYGSKIKGLSIMGDLILDIAADTVNLMHLHETVFAESKVIRFKRENLFEQFMSGLEEQEMSEQMVVPIEEMLEVMEEFALENTALDSWAQNHGSDVLWVVYEDCRKSPTECFRTMFEFLGVDEPPHELWENVASFRDTLSGSALGDRIENLEEVRLALHSNGWGHFVDESDNQAKGIQLLLYETEPIGRKSNVASLSRKSSRIKGINATVFGQGTVFDGFGSKYAAVKPLLEEMDPEDIVVLSDSRDVIINMNNNLDGAYSILRSFRETVVEMLEGNRDIAIVSAEAQCCVSALTHVSPGDLFDVEGNRKLLACPSGEDGCEWEGDDEAVPWEVFMQELARTRGFGKSSDVFLNAGLMVGRAETLLNLVTNLRMEETEDDQAVLTDYMFRFPEAIALDYEQRLFGSNRWIDGMEGGGCIFELDDDGEQLYHAMTETSPLFIHSNGGFFACQRRLQHLLNNGEDRIISRRYQQSKVDPPLSTTAVDTTRELKAFKKTKAPKKFKFKAPKNYGRRALRAVPSSSGTDVEYLDEGEETPRELKAFKKTKAPKKFKFKAPKNYGRRALKDLVSPTYY